MGLRSFKSVEKEDTKATLLTGLTGIRFFGGLTLSGLIASKGIDPTTTFYTAGALAGTDLEGSLISLTSKLPRLQKALRIIPTTFGRLFDPVADRALAIPVFGAELYTGVIPPWQGVGMLATEASTSITAIYKKSKGADPQAPKPGKIGFVARLGAAGADMAIPAFAGSDHLAHEILANSSDVLAAAGIALGAVSCAIIARTQAGETSPPELTTGSSTDITT